MNKEHILKKNYDFNRIINSQKPFKSKNLILYIEKNNNDNYQFGISIGKKIGNAVTRNKLKRQIKSIITKNNYKNGFNCIIIVKKGILNLSFLQIEEELYNQFDKIDILKEKEYEK